MSITGLSSIEEPQNQVIKTTQHFPNPASELPAAIPDREEHIYGEARERP